MVTLKTPGFWCPIDSNNVRTCNQEDNLDYYPKCNFTMLGSQHSPSIETKATFLSETRIICDLPDIETIETMTEPDVVNGRIQYSSAITVAMCQKAENNEAECATDTKWSDPDSPFTNTFTLDTGTDGSYTFTVVDLSLE